MIRFFDEADLMEYMASGDPLSGYLGLDGCEGWIAERWLRESPAKRMIAWHVYGDLLEGEGRRIIDVGAGWSSITSRLQAWHDYWVVDIANASHQDWRDVEFDCDLLISVDLFPNVDQGLAAFLRKAEGIPRRLVLTTYANRVYRAKRIDADEVLTVQAWDWPQTSAVLGETAEPRGNLFDNGRQVCLVV